MTKDQKSTLVGAMALLGVSLIAAGYGAGLVAAWEEGLNALALTLGAGGAVVLLAGLACEECL